MTRKTVDRRDRARVNVNEDYELRYWTKEFGCTGTELRNAVKAVGPMVDKGAGLPQESEVLISGPATPQPRVVSAPCFSIFGNVAIHSSDWRSSTSEDVWQDRDVAS